MGWPVELVERFRARRVALFIGAGCTRSAGLPGWKELLESLQNRFRDNHIADDAELQKIKGWWAKSADFPRIAKFFSDRDKEFYRRAMQSIFDPPRARADYKPPPYFHYFPALGVTTIVTTNFDALLEDALTPRRFSALTWHDSDEFERFLRDQRTLIFHLHGIASRFGTVVHTLDEYRALEGPNGRQALDFLGRIIERDTLLFVGYGLADREIAFVVNQYHQNWKRRPDWYLLAANPTADTIRQMREECGLMVIPYTPAAGKADGHGTAIEAMFVDLAGRLGIADLGVPLPPESTAQDDVILEVTRDFLGAQPPITSETRRQFYRGAPPTWALLKNNATAQRNIVANVLRKIDEGTPFILLTGAGGEGKSTVLKQVAIALAERGDRVFFATADETLDLRDLLKRERGKITILIDDAEDLTSAEGLITFAERRRDPTQLILGARANEWRERHQGHPNLRRLVEQLSLTRLNERETNEIAHLIYESGANRTGADEKTLALRLRADTNGFLLAAMLVATQGRQLQEILRDVVETVATWQGGEILIKALAVVVAHESQATSQKNRMFCSQRLFREVMGSISKQGMHQLCNRLTGEVSLTPRGGYRVETRHPIIADALARVLFDPPTPLIDQMDVYEWIISAAGRFSRDEVNPGERKLLTNFPISLKRRGRVEEARRLFKAATEADPHDAPTWQAWALMEKDANNIGAIDQPGTARFLFNKGIEADRHNAPSWQAWALMEKDANNIGAIDQPGTARFLFNKGTEADPHHAPVWQAWALMEKDANNVGAIDQPGTARFLFNKGTEADPHNAPSWQAWALMEFQIGERGEAERLRDQGLLHCPRAPELLWLNERFKSAAHEAPIILIQQFIDAGDISAAKAELGKALSIDPTNRELLRIAGELSRSTKGEVLIGVYGCLLTSNSRRSAGCAGRPLPGPRSWWRRKCGTPGRGRRPCPAPPPRLPLPKAR